MIVINVSSFRMPVTLMNTLLRSLKMPWMRKQHAMYMTSIYDHEAPGPNISVAPIDGLKNEGAKLQGISGKVSKRDKQETVGDRCNPFTLVDVLDLDISGLSAHDGYKT
jgi:hypothetical protein